jgi:nucleoside-diphosphate-sugar epimerase
MSESNIQQYLIVGGDSMIGRYLYNRLKKHGEQVLYTTRRKSVHKDSAVYLDLENNIETWMPPKGITTAFFCAAKTSITFCERHANESRKTNVVNTVKIIEKLSQKGIFVVFIIRLSGLTD